MKQVEAFIIIRDFLKNSHLPENVTEAYEFFDTFTGKLEEKEAKSQEKKDAAKAERSKILDRVIEILQDREEPLTCKEIRELYGDPELASGRLTYVLREGVVSGKLIKDSSDRVITYRV